MNSFFIRIIALILLATTSFSRNGTTLALPSSSSSTTFATRNTHIIQLTDENFEHLTQASSGQTTGKWFVNFSSPKCPHCIKLYPVWNELAEQMKSDPESSVLIGIVDISQNPRLVNRFQIKSMPTLYFFANGGMYHYEPQRSRRVEDFVFFVTEEYQRGEKMQVPSTPKGILKMIESTRRALHEMDAIRVLLNDLENIVLYRKNAAALLLVLGFGMGIFVSVGINKCRAWCQSCRKSSASSRDEFASTFEKKNT
jgi:Thioredoxin domain-containing protein